MIAGLSPAAVRALLRRPDLWPTAARVGATLAPRRWWRRRPPAPVPDAAWMRFRLTTAYGGDGDGALSAEELVAYLEWCRDFPR